MAPSAAGRVDDRAAGNGGLAAPLDVHVKAAVRLRPLPADIVGRSGSTSCFGIIDAHSLAIVDPSAVARGTHSTVPSTWQEEEFSTFSEDDELECTDRKGKQLLELTFNGGVFGEKVDTSTLYVRTVQPFVIQLSEGVSSVVVLQGAVNSGKSFCCFGTLDHPGLSFLALQDLFSHIASYKDEDSERDKPETETPSLLPWNSPGGNATWRTRDYEFAVRCSLVEIRQGMVVDLLHCCSNGLRITDTFPTLVLQRVHSSKTFAVAGLSEADITSTAEALPLLAKAAAVKKARDLLLATPSCSILSITVEKATTTAAAAVGRAAARAVSAASASGRERRSQWGRGKAAAAGGGGAAEGEAAGGREGGEEECPATQKATESSDVDEQPETATAEAVEITEAKILFVVLEGLDATAVSSLNQVLHRSREEEEERDVHRGDETLDRLLNREFVADANLCVIATADASAENLPVSLSVLQKTAPFSGVVKQVKQKRLAPEESRLHSIHRVLLEQYQQRKQLLQVLQETAAKQRLVSASLLETRQAQWWRLSEEEVRSKVAALEQDLEASRRKLLSAAPGACWRLLEASRTSAVLYILSGLRHRRFLVEVLKEERQQPGRRRLAGSTTQYSARASPFWHPADVGNGVLRVSGTWEDVSAGDACLSDRARGRRRFSAASPPHAPEGREPQAFASLPPSSFPPFISTLLLPFRGIPVGRHVQRRDSGDTQQLLQQQQDKGSHRHSARAFGAFARAQAPATTAAGETRKEKTHVLPTAAAASFTCLAAAETSASPAAAATWQPQHPPQVRVVNITQQQRQLLQDRDGAFSRGCGSSCIRSLGLPPTSGLPRIWSASPQAPGAAVLPPPLPSSAALSHPRPAVAAATRSAAFPAADRSCPAAAARRTVTASDHRPAPQVSAARAAAPLSSAAAGTAAAGTAAARAGAGGPATAGGGRDWEPASRAGGDTFTSERSAAGCSAAAGSASLPTHGATEQRFATLPAYGLPEQLTAAATDPLAATAATLAATSAAAAHFVAPGVSFVSPAALACPSVFSSSSSSTAAVAPYLFSPAKAIPTTGAYYALIGEAAPPSTLTAAAAATPSIAVPAAAPHPATAAAGEAASAAVESATAPPRPTAAAPPRPPPPAAAPAAATAEPAPATAAPAASAAPTLYYVAAAPPSPCALPSAGGYFFPPAATRCEYDAATAAATPLPAAPTLPLKAATAAATVPTSLSLATPCYMGGSYSGSSTAAPPSHVVSAAAPQFLSASGDCFLAATAPPFPVAAAMPSSCSAARASTSRSASPETRAFCVGPSAVPPAASAPRVPAQPTASATPPLPAAPIPSPAVAFGAPLSAAPAAAPPASLLAGPTSLPTAAFTAAPAAFAAAPAAAVADAPAAGLATAPVACFTVAPADTFAAAPAATFAAVPAATFAATPAAGFAAAPITAPAASRHVTVAAAATPPAALRVAPTASPAAGCHVGLPAAAAPAAAAWSPALCAAASATSPTQQQTAAATAPTSPAVPLFFGMLAICSSQRQEAARGEASAPQRNDNSPTCPRRGSAAAAAALPRASAPFHAGKSSSAAASPSFDGGISAHDDGCFLPSSDAAAAVPAAAAALPPADIAAISPAHAAAASSVCPAAAAAAFADTPLPPIAVVASAAASPRPSPRPLPAAKFAAAVPAAPPAASAAAAKASGDVSLGRSHVPDAFFFEEERREKEGNGEVEGETGRQKGAEKEGHLQQVNNELVCDPACTRNRARLKCSERAAPDTSGRNIPHAKPRYYVGSRISSSSERSYTHKNSSGRSSSESSCCNSSNSGGCICSHRSNRGSSEKRPSAVLPESSSDKYKLGVFLLSNKIHSAAVQQFAVALEKIKPSSATRTRQPQRNRTADEELCETDVALGRVEDETEEASDGQPQSSNGLWGGGGDGCCFCCSDVEAPRAAGGAALFSTAATHGSPPAEEVAAASLSRARGGDAAAAGGGGRAAGGGGQPTSCAAAADALLSDFLGATTDSPFPTATEEEEDDDSAGSDFLRELFGGPGSASSPAASRLPGQEESKRAGEQGKRKPKEEEKEEKEEERQQQEHQEKEEQEETSHAAAAVHVARPAAAKGSSAAVSKQAEGPAAAAAAASATPLLPPTTSSSGAALLEHAAQLQGEILDLLRPEAAGLGESLQSGRRGLGSPATSAACPRRAASPSRLDRCRPEEPALPYHPAAPLHRSCEPSRVSSRTAGGPPFDRGVGSPAYCGHFPNTSARLGAECEGKGTALHPRGTAVFSQSCENPPADCRALSTPVLVPRRKMSKSICLRLSLEPEELRLGEDDQAAAGSGAAGRSAAGSGAAGRNSSSNAGGGGIALVGTPTEIRFSLSAADGDAGGENLSAAEAAGRATFDAAAATSEWYAARVSRNGNGLNGSGAAAEEEGQGVSGLLRRPGGESWEIRYAAARRGADFCLPERRPGDTPAWAQSKQQLYFRETLRPWNRDSTPAVRLRQERREPAGPSRGTTGRGAGAGRRAAAPARRRCNSHGCERGPGNNSSSSNSVRQQKRCGSCCSCTCSRQPQGDTSSGDEEQETEKQGRRRFCCRAAEKAAAEETAQKFWRDSQRDERAAEEEEEEEEGQRKKLAATAEAMSLGDTDSSRWTTLTAEETRQGTRKLFARERHHHADTPSVFGSSSSDSSAAGRVILSSAEPRRVAAKDRGPTPGGGASRWSLHTATQFSPNYSSSNDLAATTPRASQTERLRAMYRLPSGISSSRSSGEDRDDSPHSPGRVQVSSSSRCGVTVESWGRRDRVDRGEPQQAESPDGYSFRDSSQRAAGRPSRPRNAAEDRAERSAAAFSAERLSPPRGARVPPGGEDDLVPSASGLPPCGSDGARGAYFSFVEPPDGYVPLQRSGVFTVSAAARPQSTMKDRIWRPPILQGPADECVSHLQEWQEPLQHKDCCASPQPASLLQHTTYSSAVSFPSAVYSPPSSISCSSSFPPLQLGPAFSRLQAGSDPQRTTVTSAPRESSVLAEADKQHGEIEPETPTFGRSNAAGSVPLSSTAAERAGCSAVRFAVPAGPEHLPGTSSSVLGSYFSSIRTGSATPRDTTTSVLGSTTYGPSTLSAAGGVGSSSCSRLAYYPGWSTGVSSSSSSNSVSTDAGGTIAGGSYNDRNYKVICTIRRDGRGVPMDLSPVSPLQERTRTIYPLTHISEYSVVGDASDATASLLHPTSTSGTTPAERSLYCGSWNWAPPVVAHPSVNSLPQVRLPHPADCSCASGSPQVPSSNSEAQAPFRQAGNSSFVYPTAASAALNEQRPPQAAAAEGKRAADGCRAGGCAQACKGAEGKVSPHLEVDVAAGTGLYPGSAENPLLLGPLPGPERTVDFSSLYTPAAGVPAAAAAVCTDQRESSNSEAAREGKARGAQNVEDNVHEAFLQGEHKDEAAAQETPKEQTLWGGMVGFLGEKMKKFWEERKKPEATQAPQRSAASAASSFPPFVQSAAAGGVQFERRSRRRRSASCRMKTASGGAEGPLQPRRGGEERTRREEFVGPPPVPQPVALSCAAEQGGSPAQAAVQLLTPQLAPAVPPLTAPNSPLLQAAGPAPVTTLVAPGVSVQTYPSVAYNVPVAQVQAPPGSIVLTGDTGVTTPAGAPGAVVAAPATDPPEGPLLAASPAAYCAPGALTQNPCILASSDASGGVAAAAAPHTFPLDAALLTGGTAAGGGAAAAAPVASLSAAAFSPAAALPTGSPLVAAFPPFAASVDASSPAGGAPGAPFAAVCTATSPVAVPGQFAVASAGPAQAPLAVSLTPSPSPVLSAGDTANASLVQGTPSELQRVPSAHGGVSAAGNKEAELAAGCSGEASCVQTTGATAGVAAGFPSPPVTATLQPSPAQPVEEAAPRTAVPGSGELGVVTPAAGVVTATPGGPHFAIPVPQMPATGSGISLPAAPAVSVVGGSEAAGGTYLQTQPGGTPAAGLSGGGRWLVGQAQQLLVPQASMLGPAGQVATTGLELLQTPVATPTAAADASGGGPPAAACRSSPQLSSGGPLAGIFTAPAQSPMAVPYDQEIRHFVQFSDGSAGLQGGGPPGSDAASPLVPPHAPVYAREEDRPPGAMRDKTHPVLEIGVLKRPYESQF